MSDLDRRDFAKLAAGGAVLLSTALVAAQGKKS